MTTETENAVEGNDNVESSSLLDATANTDTTASDDGVTTESQENDYSYVPEKFLNEDGTPNLENLAKSYSELEKKASSKVGVESIDDYDFAFDNKDVFDPEADLSDLKNEMKELGISKDQFNGVMGLWENATADVIEELQGTPERAQEALTEVWGDDFDKNLSLARSAWDTFATDGMNIDSVGNNPIVLELLANIGAQLCEDTNIPSGANAGTGMTQTEVEEIMAREDYWTNKELQEKVAGFFASRNR